MYDVPVHALLDLLARNGTVTFLVRVKPGAKRTHWRPAGDDDVLTVALQAPAKENKANIALIRFIARSFGVPLAHVTLVTGHTSRLKRIRVDR